MENTHTRVRYAGQPTSSSHPKLPAYDIELGSMKVHELRNLRSNVDVAIQADQVADHDMLNYLNLQERVAQRIAALELRDQYTQNSAQQQPPQQVSAPAYLGTVGDTRSGLSNSFSISRALLQASEGRQLQGAEAEMTAEGRRECAHARGAVVLPSWALQKRNVYGNTAGTYVNGAVTGKQTLSAGMLAANHGEPVLQALGATLVDAVGASSLLVPYLGRTAAAVMGEGEAITSSATFSELSLTPIRYGRRADVTQLALRTNGSAIDQVLLQDFAAAHAWAQDTVGFNAIRNSATFVPATETGTDDLAATTLDNIMDLVTATMNATRSSAAPVLVCSPIGFDVLNSVVATNLSQTLAQAYISSAAGQVIAAVGMADADIPAEKALLSVAADRKIVGAGLVAAGLFQDLVLARWGGVDVVLDPYSDADNGVLRVVANSYVNAGVVRDSFRCLAVASATITDVAD